MESTLYRCYITILHQILAFHWILVPVSAFLRIQFCDEVLEVRFCAHNNSPISCLAQAQRPTIWMNMVCYTWNKRNGKQSLCESVRNSLLKRLHNQMSTIEQNSGCNCRLRWENNVTNKVSTTLTTKTVLAWLVKQSRSLAERHVSHHLAVRPLKLVL